MELNINWISGAAIQVDVNNADSGMLDAKGARQLASDLISVANELLQVEDKKVTWRDYKVTGKKGELMEMTEENFTKVCAMRDELIFEQKDEIAKLKIKINKLQQKLEVSQ